MNSALVSGKTILLGLNITTLITHSHQNLSCLKSGVSQLSAVSLPIDRGLSTLLLRQLKAWFPLDRNGIVKSCDSIWFQLTVERLISIENKNLTKIDFRHKRFLSQILTNPRAKSESLLGSHDPTILLRSNGNQA